MGVYPERVVSQMKLAKAAENRDPLKFFSYVFTDRSASNLKKKTAKGGSSSTIGNRQSAIYNRIRESHAHSLSAFQILHSPRPHVGNVSA